MQNCQYNRFNSIIFLALAIFITSCDERQQLPSLSQNAVIVAFGDSLTSGTGASSSQSYPAILGKLINRNVINAGIPGELSESGLLRLPEVLKEYKPVLLILCHGGNDILQKKDLNKTSDNINQMISLSKDMGTTVILLGVPQPGIFLRSADFYKKIAEQTGVIFVGNLIPDILSDKSMKSDPVHPNNKGYIYMAEYLASLMSEMGAI